MIMSIARRRVAMVRSMSRSSIIVRNGGVMIRSIARSLVRSLVKSMVRK